MTKRTYSNARTPREATLRRRDTSVPSIPVDVQERIDAITTLCATLNDISANLHAYAQKPWQLRVKIESARTWAGVLAQHYRRVSAGVDDDSLEPKPPAPNPWGVSF